MKRSSIDDGFSADGELKIRVRKCVSLATILSAYLESVDYKGFYR